MKLFVLFFIAILLLASGNADAKIHRSAAAKHAFQRDHRCPSTDRSKGSCPGYIIDHIKPLCAGGADDPTNMQWQTISDAHTKDKIEWRECRSMKLQ